MNLAHAAITVKDMEKSLRFYEEGFGMKKAFEMPRPETGEPWIVYVYIGEGQFMELFYGGENDYAWDEKDRAYNHLCFETEDIHKAVARLQEAGYTMDILPNVGCDGNWQAWITDPDGVRIEIMQVAPDSPQREAAKRLSGKS